jgi:hypothetical protein
MQNHSSQNESLSEGTSYPLWLSLPFIILLWPACIESPLIFFNPINIILYINVLNVFFNFLITHAIYFQIWVFF